MEIDHGGQSTEITRTEEKVIRIVGGWAVHTFLDNKGNILHSVGFPRKPLFSEEDIAAHEASYVEYGDGDLSLSWFRDRTDG